MLAELEIRSGKASRDSLVDPHRTPNLRVRTPLPTRWRNLGCLADHYQNPCPVSKTSTKSTGLRAVDYATIDFQEAWVTMTYTQLV
jgi:hypothetical protein